MTEPRIGDYGVVDMRGVFGWAIRVGTRSPAAHAFVYVGDGRIVEAMPDGARLAELDSRPGAIYNTADPAWRTVGDEGLARGAVSEAALGKVGVPYGFSDIVSVGLLQIGIRPPLIRAWVRRSDRLICSQLVDLCYLEAGLHLYDDGRLPMDVTPGDLLRRVRQYQAA